jgi:hypothetical protein
VVHNAPKDVCCWLLFEFQADIPAIFFIQVNVKQNKIRSLDFPSFDDLAGRIVMHNVTSACQNGLECIPQVILIIYYHNAFHILLAGLVLLIPFVAGEKQNDRGRQVNITFHIKN